MRSLLSHFLQSVGLNEDCGVMWTFTTLITYEQIAIIIYVENAIDFY